MAEIFAPITIFHSCIQDTPLPLFILPFAVQFILLWNVLPTEIRMSPNRDKFKAKVRHSDFILYNYFYINKIKKVASLGMFTSLGRRMLLLCWRTWHSLIHNSIIIVYKDLVPPGTQTPNLKLSSDLKNFLPLFTRLWKK